MQIIANDRTIVEDHESTPNQSLDDIVEHDFFKVSECGYLERCYNTLPEFSDFYVPASKDEYAFAFVPHRQVDQELVE